MELNAAEHKSGRQIIFMLQSIVLGDFVQYENDAYHPNSIDNVN